MKITSELTVVLLLLATLAGTPCARADQLVQVAPHRTAAWPDSSESAPPLLGFLARPTGPGRFPAVVLLHGCIGFSGHDTAAAAVVKSWGYIALAVDSLGAANMCTASGGGVAEAHDAFLALRYLAEQSFVTSDRVAVMGYSMGGLAALVAVDEGGIQPSEQPRFRAMVAYYPTCQYSAGILTAPGLILTGELGDRTFADACRKLAAHESDIGITRRPGAGAPVELVVYPDATPGFDVHLPPRRYLGLFEQYNEDATHDAEIRVRAFLRRELGDPM